MKHLSEFTHKYSLSKTLRFALNPIGKTVEHIKKNDLLGKDTHRAEQYKKAKKIIDLYHKDFIEETLKQVTLSFDDLGKFSDAYNEVKKDKKSTDAKKELAKQQEQLRKTIAKNITDTPKYKRLFKKELIQKDLPEWLEKHPNVETHGLDHVLLKDYPEIEIIEEFEKWTTYFKGFHENRKNMYTAESHSTAIAYRIVHENLPKFLDNVEKWNNLLKTFPDIKKNFKEQLSLLEQSMSMKLSSVFKLEYFNQCLNQGGIDIYSTILGGKSEEKNSKLQGINEIINLYRQQKEHKLKNTDDTQKEELRKDIKTLRGLKMQNLYKQILSDRESHSFLLENFENDKALIDAIKTFHTEITTDTHAIDGENTSMLSGLQSCLKWLNNDDCDIKKIYVSSRSLSDLSHACFKDWNIIRQALEKYAETKFPSRKDTPTKTELNKRESWIKNTKYFNLDTLQKAIDGYVKTLDMDEKEEYRSIIQYFSGEKIEKIIEGKKENKSAEKINVFHEINNTWDEAKDVLETEYSSTSNKLHQEKDKVKKIKNFLDSSMQLLHFAKPLYIETNDKTEKDTKSSDVFDKDASFYHNFDLMYEQLCTVIKLYNKARNYLARKAFKVEKYKLNFDNNTLLDGLDVNQEVKNKGVFFLKDGKYYLGIMDKQHNKLFKNVPEEVQKKGYKKVYYKQLPGAYRMLPKVFFAKNNIEDYNPSKEILRIHNHATHTKTGAPRDEFDKHEFNLNDCHSFIDFFKQSIDKHPDWKQFDFNFSPTKQYNDIKEFYREVETQGYKLTYGDISEEYINTCIDEGKLYLFEIYNKDFSDKSTGKPNLHTLYWKALFDETNLKDVIYKLNGEAELFFRKASIKYNSDIWEKGHHYNDNKKLKEKFKYPIIKDKRYARDTYLFHVPITINFKENKKFQKFNDAVNTYLKNNPDVNILSIDRGERHLAYYTLLNQKGEIKEQRSLNTTTYRVKGEKEERRVDYHQKLHTMEIERDKARKSWDTIQTIKELKEGYLSQIVHTIATMMVQHNAIVVFEDLNFGFKRTRLKFEKQIYQKLEKMLIDKLNYLVFKDKTAGGEIGSTLCGYQLTAPFESFQKLGKQTGFIFYVPAYHTSKICPATGFVNLLYPKYQNIKGSQEFFGTFNTIQFNEKENFFEFHLDYSEFVKNKFIKKTDEKKAWTICTNGTRLSNNKEKNQWKTNEIILTDCIISLLNKRGIEYKHGKDLRESIMKQNESDFFKSLFHYLKLTLQLRNSRQETEDETNNENDYILSCVKDEQGHFFDSRKYNDTSVKPVNSDANGAYHIGLKGLWVLQQINKWESGKLNLAISNEQWYDFVQNKKYL